MHATIFAALIALAAGGPARSEILVTGMFHGDEVQARTGEAWLCLMSAPDREELRPCTIEVEQVYDAIMGDDTGKSVSLRDGGDALVLVRNVPALRPGPVRTYFLGDARIMPEGYLGVGGEDRLHVGLQRNHKGSYSLFLWDSKVSVRQTLRDDAFPDGGPTLLWAGDLDRDGKLDLLLDVTNHYNVSEIALFLSSLAGPGELVGKARIHRSVGC